LQPGARGQNVDIGYLEVLMTALRAGALSESTDIRRAAAGEPQPGLEILRKAVRGQDLQLLIAGPDGSCWVTRFVEGRIGISCCIDEPEAQSYFDFCLASPTARGQWTQVDLTTDQAA
jgi:hypothetical protein